MFLQDYNFKIEYIKGKQNHTDFLSRRVENGCYNVESSKYLVEDIDKIQDIVKCYHEELGHAGGDAVLYMIRKEFCIPKLNTMVRNI
ncbi:hypothetical protein COBT_001364 [Conglomerata obtusa]